MTQGEQGLGETLRGRPGEDAISRGEAERPESDWSEPSGQRPAGGRCSRPLAPGRESAFGGALRRARPLDLQHFSSGAGTHHPGPARMAHPTGRTSAPGPAGGAALRRGGGSGGGGTPISGAGRQPAAGAEAAADPPWALPAAIGPGKQESPAGWPSPLSPTLAGGSSPFSFRQSPSLGPL